MSEPIFSKQRLCEHVEIRLWTPGESEEGLWGFDTIADRDKAERGEPAWRRVRPAHLPPPSLESQITRAYLDGDLDKAVAALGAGGTQH